MRKTHFVFLIIFLMTGISAFAQNRIKGKITDEKGEELIGVNVLIKGTSVGTISDVNGEFHLSAKQGDVLTCTYVGYTSQEVKIATNYNLEIVLKEDVNTVEEVVVIGYGTAKKKDFTGALSTVDSKKLKEANRSSIGQALQGQIAGVDIVKSNNKPGAGINIMVRGQNTIRSEKGGDERTDLNDINGPLYVVDGMFVDGINDISPDDIERIDVLKDASSTAIYGSRGANGVVIVSTKRGNENRSHVEYTGSVTMGSVMNLPDFYDTEGYVKYRMDRKRGENWKNPVYEPDLEEVLGTQQYNNYKVGKTIDWADEFFETSISTSHSVRAYGTGKGINYTFGASYTKEDGVSGKDGYERYNVSTAIDKQLNKVLKAGTNIYAAYEISDASSDEVFRSIFRLNPLTDKYNEDGTLRLFPDETISNISNPFLEVRNQFRQSKRLHVFGNLYLEYKPTSWLKFTTTFTPDLAYGNDGEYRGKDTKSSKGNQLATRAVYGTDHRMKYTWDNVAYIEKKVGEHSGNLTVGTSWFTNSFENSSMRADGFSTDNYTWYNMGAGLMKSMSTQYFQEQLSSYFARLNYDLKGRYMLTVTGRYDGSSKLAAGHRWAFFPSAALGWRMSDEAFLKNVEAISNLKLRASYGVSGSDRAVSPYQSAQNVQNNKYIFGTSGVNTVYFSGFENKMLTWEKTKELNIGLDYAFLNGRINGAIDWYDRRTHDIIMDRKLPDVNGYGALKDNVGSVLNRGIEISLNTINIQTKDFTWTTSINFTKNHNEILELSNGLERDEANRWFVGESIGAVWTYTPIGFWQESEKEEAAKYGMAPGNLKLVDKNNDYAFTDADKDIKGSVFPKWTGGMTNSFKYKNIDLSLFIYTRQGQYSYSQFHRHYTMNDNKSFNAVRLNYWTPENTTGTWMRPGLSINGAESETVLYQKTSFTKVGYINLGYSIPDVWVRHMGLSKLRVYGSIQNPFVFTDYNGWDPETASENTYTQYAMTRSFMVGLNVTF